MNGIFMIFVSYSRNLKNPQFIFLVIFMVLAIF